MTTDPPSGSERRGLSRAQDSPSPTKKTTCARSEPSPKNSVPSSSTYPSRPADRTRWILSRRGPKNLVDATRAYATLWEEEPDAAGDLVSTATVFLTNRECPYRCLMCDLWRNTLNESVPTGKNPAQLVDALSNLPAARQVKLYNAGSFFDSNAIPVDDYPAIAQICAGYERVIVECHPALVGQRVLDFKSLLNIRYETELSVRSPGLGGHQVTAPRLEVAIGLETAHEGVLDKLNKRFTLDDFRRAANFLTDHDIDLRVFLLLRPPFMTEAEGVDWAKRSIDVAFDSGATVVCVIPTRDGNGAMEALRESGDWSPPSVQSLEEVQQYGVSLKRGRVFADLWDIERFYVEEADVVRGRRIEERNLAQESMTGQRK